MKTMYPELSIDVNGDSLTYEEINRWNVKRAAHVLQELSEQGAQLYLGDKKITLDDTLEFTNEELLAACADTKVKLGKSGILELMADKIKQSDQMWYDIQKNSEPGKFKTTHVYVNIKGIKPETIAKLITTDNSNALNERVAFGLHAEHYVFGLEGTTQEVMETIGAYKEPTYFKLQILDPKTDAPTKPNPKAAAIGLAKQYLVHDSFDTGLYAMHQFIPTEDGVQIDLGLFVPTATPAEFIIGHREHFAIEFANVAKNFITLNRQKNN